MIQELEQKKCAFGCGKPVHRGKRLCLKHLKHQRLKMAEFRTERKRLGLCTRCDRKARVLSDGSISTLCETHRSKVRALEKKQRVKEQIARILKLTIDHTNEQISAKERLSETQVRQIVAKHS